MNEGVCRALVVARAGGRCERCGGIGQSMHHRKKRSHLPRDNQWSPDNVVLVCGNGTMGCHGWIESHPGDAERTGFHVRPWESPDEVPIKISSQWFTLNENGGMDESEERREEDDMAPEGGELLFGRGTEDFSDSLSASFEAE